MVTIFMMDYQDFRDVEDNYGRRISEARIGIIVMRPFRLP